MLDNKKFTYNYLYNLNFLYNWKFYFRLYFYSVCKIPIPCIKTLNKYMKIYDLVSLKDNILREVSRLIFNLFIMNLYINISLIIVEIQLLQFVYLNTFYKSTYLI